MGVQCCSVYYDRPRLYLDHCRDAVVSVKHAMIAAAIAEIERMLADGTIDERHAQRLTSRIWNFHLEVA